MHRTNNEPGYRTLMDGIEMPSRLQDRILHKTRRERAAASHGVAPAAPRRNARPMPRRRFVGVAAAAVVAVACGGTAVFAAVGRPARNSFSLELSDFGHDSAWKAWHNDPEIDPDNAENAPDEGQRYLSVAYEFNPICTGTNVTSLTYEIEGERVLFYTHEASSGENRATSFTVDYHAQIPAAPDWRGLRVSFPLEGEIAGLYDAVTEEFYSSRRDVDYNRQDRLNALLLRRYANIIAQARLHLAVTYEDGSTEAKAYAITPVDNLEDVEAAYAAAIRAQAEAAQGNLTQQFEEIPRPQLFVLTELG